jgi:hypothetical protein
MVNNYESFIKDLARKYQKQNSIKEFPFAIKSMKQGLIEFENPSDVQILTSTASLSNIAFYAQCAKKDDSGPIEFKESMDIFRR